MKARLRDLGITIGEFPTGEHNAITDVPGVFEIEFEDSFTFITELEVR